jgi:DNA-binding beta-propeller fold protein YncE
VIEDAAGNIYVATLGDNAIHMIAATTHRDTILQSGLSSPQGIIFDAAGDLVVTDPGHHRLLKIVMNHG